MLSRRIFSNTTAAIADQLITKIGTTLAFVVLVRILPANDIATLGIATSYMVVVSYLDVGLIRILLQGLRAARGIARPARSPHHGVLRVLGPADGGHRGRSPRSCSGWCSSR